MTQSSPETFAEWMGYAFGPGHALLEVEE